MRDRSVPNLQAVMRLLRERVLRMTMDLRLVISRSMLLFFLRRMGESGRAGVGSVMEFQGLSMEYKILQIYQKASVIALDFSDILRSFPLPTLFILIIVILLHEQPITIFYLTDYHIQKINQIINMLKLLLSSLVLWNAVALVLFQRSDMFGSFQVRLYNQDSTLSATTNKRFSFANLYNYQNMQVIGMALNGFDWPSVNVLNFTAEPTYSYENNSFILTIIVDPSSAAMNVLVYNILAVNSNYNTIVDLQSPCYVPSQTSTISPILGYTQSFNFTTAFNRTSTDEIVVMSYLRSITNIAIQGYNYFNASNYVHQVGNIVTFTLSVNYAVIQKFCITAVMCHWTNLKLQPLLNASYTKNRMANSTDPLNTFQIKVDNKFGMNPVYGPIYNYKCVVGLSSFRIVNMGSVHAVSFDITSTISVVADNSSSAYLLEFSSFCLVDLQCQYLYQQYYVLINDCQDTCSIAQCDTCTTSTSCSVCQSGYFVNSLMRCEACLSNCQVCSTTASCTTCVSGYYYYTANLTCVPCSLNCLACNTAGCTSCVAGYYPSLTSCLACPNAIPNCVTCNSAQSCTKCKDGFTFTNGQMACYDCSSIKNCRTCSLTTRCDICVTGYYVNGYYCQPCTYTIDYCCNQSIPFCAKCTNNTYCSGCTTGYFFPPNTTLNSVCLSCSQVIPNCSQCSTNTICTNCLSGAYLQDGVCIPCSLAISNCLSCYSSTLCSSCTAGLVVVSGQCSPCGSAGQQNLYYVLNNICYKCSNGIANCYRCQSSSICSECNSGYYLSSSSKCVICGSIIKSCLVCLDSSVCLACEAGTFLNATTCTDCSSVISNCVTCSYSGSALTCLLCSEQSYMNNNQCLTCSVMTACQKCKNSTVCTNCAPGYYLSISQCLPCQVANCVTCLSASQCTLCSVGYFLTDAGECSTCSVMDQCLYCPNSTYCSACATRYFINSSGLCQECFSAMTNCITCQNSTYCSTCLTSYYLIANFTGCLPCSSLLSNCLSCASTGTTCLICQSSYFLTVGGSCSTCRQYIPYCAGCTNTTTCLSCSIGYYLIPLTYNSVSNPNNLTNNCSQCQGYINNCYKCINTTNCAICNSGYFADALGRCSLCSNYIVYCTNCSSSSVCTACQVGYVVSNNICLQCTPIVAYCLECLQAGSPELCGKCQDGYYLSATRTCLSCGASMTYCSNCSSGTLCLNCTSGHYLSSSSSGCGDCPTSCSSCPNSTYCEVCSSGYYLLDDHTCKACIENCLKCNNSDYCLTCNSGYYANSSYLCSSCTTYGGDCLACDSSECTVKAASSSSLWMVVAIVALVLLVAMVVVLVVWCVRRKREEEKGEGGSTVGVSDRMLKVEGGEQDFEVPHDGLCRLCGVNKLQLMTIQLLCGECEQRKKSDKSLGPLVPPIRKEIVIGKSETNEQMEQKQ